MLPAHTHHPSFCFIPGEGQVTSLHRDMEKRIREGTPAALRSSALALFWRQNVMWEMLPMRRASWHQWGWWGPAVPGAKLQRGLCCQRPGGVHHHEGRGDAVVIRMFWPTEIIGSGLLIMLSGRWSRWSVLLNVAWSVYQKNFRFRGPPKKHPHHNRESGPHVPLPDFC